MLRGLPWFALLACSTPRVMHVEARRSCAGNSESPKGDPSMYAPPDLPGFAIATPVMCGRGDAYIRVERLSGSRTLGSGTACTALPEHPADPSDCPSISAGALLDRADDDLGRRIANGIGVDRCDNAERTEISTFTSDWAHADALVHELATLLDRYDVKGFVRAGVRGQTCWIDL
ncbi:MAG TPA: hypothetical protein VGL61_33210 [Kofleriaceae bacterium]